MNDLLADAIAIAATVHAGQKDKAGEPYILHPIRVMMSVRGVERQIAAVLHDVVEDGDVTVEEIATRFGAEIAAAVDALTRRKGEDYLSFVKRSSFNPIALDVKLADLKDNLDYERVRKLPKDEIQRLIDKYQPAERFLKEAQLAAQGIPLRENRAAG